MDDDDCREAGCTMCGRDPGSLGLPWVLLNRIYLGSGNGRAGVEFLNDDGTYSWQQHEDVEQEYASGPVFCFPDCLRTYLEGRMIEIDIHFGHTK